MKFNSIQENNGRHYPKKKNKNTNQTQKKLRNNRFRIGFKNNINSSNKKKKKESKNPQKNLRDPLLICKKIKSFMKKELFPTIQRKQSRNLS